ncbi:MAG: thrombospondin type 3 repeat-containing protein [Polyangiaceae bacterium]|nr:thrombospondin type 3 repeat-containing protein [Polyangiaceae bacterium]
MLVRKGWAGVVAVLVVVGSAGTSMAAGKSKPEDGIRIDQLQPASPDSPFLRALGAHEKGINTIEFAFGASLDYGTGLLKAVSVDAAGVENVEASTVQNALLAHIGASITPLPWLVVDLALPVGLYVGGDIPEQLINDGRYGVDFNPVSAFGVGDLRAGVHFRAVDTKTMDFIVGARFWAPMGTKEAFLSDGAIRAEVDIAIAGERNALRYGCTASISPLMFIGRVDGFPHDGDRAALACAGQYRLGSRFWLGFEPTLAVFTQEQTALNTASQDHPTTIDIMIEPLISARLALGGLQIGASAGPGFGWAAGAPSFRGVLSVAYVGGGRPKAPPPKGPSDRDLDKILDKDDACPDEAGPDNKDPEKRGCPAADKDGDGIPDENDACPETTGVKHASELANGCPDIDNDLIPEPADTCPNEPGVPPYGCPKYARLAGESFVIKPPIRFAAPGSDQLTPEGQAAIEEITATMRANPKIEQVSISLGTKGVSSEISDRRAQAIIFVLRSGSLDSNRYEVVLRDDLKAGTVEARIIK